MIPELKIVDNSNYPKRIKQSDLTSERLESLRESVIDFCKKSKSFCQPMHFWAYLTNILNGKENADLWWVVDGSKVESFLVMKVYQDFDGQWTGYAMFGYCKSKAGREQYQSIVGDYKRKGVSRFQFTTVRDSKVFQRWLGTEWQSAGTLFQARY
jgi:hypothetical protein